MSESKLYVVRNGKEGRCVMVRATSKKHAKRRVRNKKVFGVHEKLIVEKTLDSH